MTNTEISGQILDSSGTAIPNAQVYLWREDLAGARGFVAQTTADANGEFTFAGHPDGTGTSETWHVAAEDPQGDSQLQSAYGVSAALPKTANSQFGTTITGVSPDPVAPGDTLTVTADVSNAGTDSDTQTVTLDIDNSVGQVDSANVTLSGGGSTTQTLSWSVPSGQTAQDYQAAVASADDTASQTVTVGDSIATLGDTQYYTDAGSGTTLTDELGTVDATISGATWQTGTGVGDAYLLFDGTDDIWSTDSAQDVSQFTVAAWVRIDSYDFADATVIGAGDGVSNDNNGFQIQPDQNSGELFDSYQGSSSGGTVNRNVPFTSAGNWGFVAVIYDGTDSRMITFDTSQELADETTSVPPDKQPTGSEVYHGGGTPVDGDHLDGALDFVMLNFGGTLSKADLTTLWNDTKGNY